MELTELTTRPVFLFDLFHTLLSMRETTVPGPETHELLGVSRETYLEAVFSNSDGRARGFVRDAIEIVEDLARGCGVTLAPTAIARIAAHRERRFHQCLQETPERILSALDSLRSAGKRLGLISNADAMEAAGWGDSPLAARFEVAIFSCHVGLVKPEPEIYTRCIEQIGASPSECVFIGDGGSNEFAGARAAGLPTIRTTEFTHSGDSNAAAQRIGSADCTVASLAELSEAVSGGAS